MSGRVHPGRAVGAQQRAIGDQRHRIGGVGGDAHLAPDPEPARDLADELCRERPIDGDVYLFIGENYESTGDLRTAHRWLTMGVQRAMNDVEDGDDLDAAENAAGLMAARLQVRRALDLPLDEYDRVVASAMLAARERSS